MSNRCVQYINKECVWKNGETTCVYHGPGHQCKVNGDLTDKMKCKTIEEKNDSKYNLADPFYKRSLTGR